MDTTKVSILLIGLLVPVFLPSGSAELANPAEASSQRTRRQAPNINVHNIPKTSFSCLDKKIGEYYADPEARCQVYHICLQGVNGKMSPMSFVCPNGTIFSQASRVCTPFDRIDCNIATKFYDRLQGDLHSGQNYGDQVYGLNDAYVPPPPPPPQPARAPASSRASPSRATPPSPPPPPAAAVEQPPARPSGGRQFRPGQFRPPQGRSAGRGGNPPRFPATTPATTTTTTTTTTTPRPTGRPGVSTSTSAYQYDYEYEYEYEEANGSSSPSPPTETRGRRSRRSFLDDYYIPSELDVQRSVLETKFTCQGKVAGEVYADIDTDCEMFHTCVPVAKLKMVDYKLFCAEGTAFDQKTATCQPKDTFDCSASEMFYKYDKLQGYIFGIKPEYYKKKGPKKSPEDGDTDIESLSR